MAKLVTDMNDRERQRFINYFKELESNAHEAARVLEEGDDDAALLAPIILIALRGNSTIKEILEMLKDAVPAEVPSDPRGL